MPPLFLSLAEVVEIHRDQIARYGGAPGIRDLGLLTSAVAMPRAGFGEEYAHGNLYSMAAAYLFHIVGNHPFIDGNKRTGVVAALVFLEMNGVSPVVDEEGLEQLVRGIAEGRIGKGAAAEFLRAR